MRIKKTIGVAFPDSVESPPLGDVVVLADSVGIAIGVQRAFTARVRGIHDNGSGFIASRCVEIPLVGPDGEVSGILCHSAPRSDTRGVLSSWGPKGRGARSENVAQFTVTARNIEPCAGADRGFVEIIVADNGEGMSEEVLAQAFTPYFTTKVAGSGTGLGLPEVQRFAEGRGGAVGIESEQGAGTLVRLFLPRVHVAGLPSGIVGSEIANTPSPNGGVFHVVKPATDDPTSWPARIP